MKSLLITIFALLSLAAHAAAVHSCDHLDSIGNLVGNVRSFAQGAIRVAHVDTEEPALAPEHLLIFVAEEPMGVSCFAVSADADGVGFNSVDMDKLQGSYDPKKGLLLSIPVRVWDDKKPGPKPVSSVKVRVSRKNNNSVTIEK